MSRKRHQGIMASWHRVRVARRQRSFSLIEVLLSVFILSIGVISIAALFPAGILQQRMSVDDITGPIVAQNALAILRTKLEPADFGTFEEFGFPAPFATIEGDWRWLRPAFIFNSLNFEPAKIDIFNGIGTAEANEYPDGSPIESGIPYNTTRYPNAAPIITFNQHERDYPMAPIKASEIRPLKPQYVWDCMFRRFQGKVMVAIFVYRTTMAGGGDVAYRVPQNSSEPDVPPMPISLELAEPWDTYGLTSGNTTADDAMILGTDPYNSANDGQSWQEPGQWILDQNNNMHRVLSQYRNDDDDLVSELVRPVPAMPVLPVYFLPNTGEDDVVTNIWYIPREITLNGVAVRLTPVYATVREL